MLAPALNVAQSKGLCLFTPEHIALQRDLHERYNYGKGVDARECADLVRGLSPGSILDYGCGHGHLKVALDGWGEGALYDVREYDPAIEGKSDRPSPADIVVCADVLEHIEPACIDNVLADLRNLSRGIAIMIIATQPSEKMMADGRQAHLILESPAWWRSRIEEKFIIDGFQDRSDIGHGLLVIGRPRPVIKLGRIHVTSAVADHERNDNVRANIQVVSKRLGLRETPNDRVAVLACFGPSLRETWPHIAMAQVNGADVFTVSGSHQFLIDRGVIPLAHMDCDPREHKAFQFGAPDRRVKYWIGSCVHPTYLKRLEGQDVTLWHCYNKEASREIFTIDPGHEMVVGGGSIGLRALSVLYCRGYRKFEIHGMDSCSSASGEHHADFHFAEYPGVAEIRCGDRWFLATAIHVAYARYFFKSQKMLKGATFSFHGNGLLAEMVKQGQLPGAEFDDTDDVQM